jgi:predicted amidohydrolase YtcJ
MFRILGYFYHPNIMNFMRYILLLFALIVSLSMTDCSSKQECDQIFHNGRIQTMDDSCTIAEAMAVRDGRICDVGSTSAIQANWSATEHIDLQNRYIFPGLIDAHAHLYGLGEEAVILTLQGTRSPDDVLTMLDDRVATLPAGTWIRGRGWDQNDWPTPQFPNKIALDNVTTTHPVFLIRIDGHAAWVNSAALHACGIDANTADPPGGRILRNSDGSPSGILLDNAIELVRSRIPAPSQEELRIAYTSAIARCLATGMTGMHDMGMDSEDIVAVRSLIDDGEFPFRMTAYIDGRGDTWEQNLSKGRQSYGEQQLTIAGLKLYADGALGSRGAWLLAPYDDDPENTGIPIIAEETIAYEAGRALDAGMQVCVHAIGDAAVRAVLNAYETALAARPHPAYPLRVEHAQVISPQDIPRFVQLGVVPSMQPTHCTSDMYWAESRLGATRIRTAYAWNKLIETGAYIPGGSDFPVERPDPLAGIHAAAFRRDAHGRPSSEMDIQQHFQTDPSAPENPDRWKNGWYGTQRMSREHAVRAFTSWAAAAAGQENNLGSLTPGTWADFVVLSGDILTVPEEQFLSTTVLETWHAGRRVYSAER